MSKTRYVQRGESLDYVNTSGKKIAAGDVIAMVSRIGVAGTDINAGETGSVHVIGVFSMEKTKAAAIPMGTAVYYDGTGITSDKDDGASSDPKAYIPAGYAAEAAAESDETILVKLVG